MNGAARMTFCLAAFLWLQPSWGAEGANGVFEECIDEPVFEGRVCTIQTNRNAKTGVLLIHGLGGSVEMDWFKTIPALSADFHVVAFDLPGFGKSDKGSKHYTPTRYARLAHFLADRYLNGKPYHVIGHSMGGAIALRFAAQQPLRLRRLVLIDAAGILHPLAITKYQAGSMLENASGVKQTRGFAERLSGKLLEQIERLPFSPTDIADTAMGRDSVLNGGPENIAALSLAGEDFSYAISTVSVPTLILWGDHDPIVPMRTGEVLAERILQARLEIIRGSGHVPMLDQTEALNTLLIKYLLASDESLSDYFHKPPPPPVFDSKRVSTCSGESGRVFEGDYRAIELKNCTDITIRNARVGKLSVVDSRLKLTNTNIMGDQIGLIANNSDITITNGKISGTVAIDASYSRLDLAGVHLSGTQASVRAVGSKLTFSLCRVKSPHMDGPLHDFRNMNNDEL